MSLPKVPVLFYIPRSEWPPQGIPQIPVTHWNSQNLWPVGGKYNHTLQTYLRLKSEGFPCDLVDVLPDEGILITHRDFLPKHTKLLDPKLLVVCIKAERTPHPYAQLHIVQNPFEESLLGSCWNAHYIPFWTQRGLVPRNPNRQDRFETVAYFGRQVNLAPELKSRKWFQQLDHLGLRWYHASEAHLWYDYSDVDVILAVRSFDEQTYDDKPASKLFNAWRAGVPVLAGNDSAFQAEYRSDLDFIKVTTLDGAIAALKYLRDNPNVRRAMRDNAVKRAADVQPEAITQQWIAFLTEVAFPIYERQRREKSISQQLSFLKRSIDTLSRRIQNQVRA